MATARIQHIYDCDEDSFWSDIVFDREYNRQLYIEHLKFKQWEVVSFEESDSQITREVVVRPVTGEMPKALAKVVGDNLGFREEGVFDKKSKRYTFRIIPNRLADKLTIEGEIYVQARGDERCERFVELTVKASVFGVGSMLEKRIIADTQESYDKGFAFACRYLAARTKPY